MPRKTKEPLEITIEAVENDSPELNEDPAALSEEIEEEAPVKKPRARKPRKPRKRAEPKVVVTEEETIAAAPVFVEATAEPVFVEASAEPDFLKATAEQAPAPIPAPAPFPIPPMPMEAMGAGENADSLVKQWESINAISTGVCNNLERVNSLVRELPANYADAISELLKPPTPKPSPLTKLAAGVSIAAAILSVLSLSLSQSARQAILNRGETPVAAATAPVPAQSAPAPRPQVAYQAPAPVIHVPQPRVSAPIAMATPTRRRITPPPTARRRAVKQRVVRKKS